MKKWQVLVLAWVHYCVVGRGDLIKFVICVLIWPRYNNFGKCTPYMYMLMLTTTVKPIPRRIDVACYKETYQRKLEMFTKRVSFSNALIYTMYCQILWNNFTECWLEWSLWLQCRCLYSPHLKSCHRSRGLSYMYVLVTKITNWRFLTF